MGRADSVHRARSQNCTPIIGASLSENIASLCLQDGSSMSLQSPQAGCSFSRASFECHNFNSALTVYITPIAECVHIKPAKRHREETIAPTIDGAKRWPLIASGGSHCIPLLTYIRTGGAINGHPNPPVHPQKTSHVCLVTYTPGS